METKVIQIRGRGTLTLPAKLRERYGLKEGDPVTVVDLDGVLLLSPKIGIVPRLTAEIEAMRERAGVSIDDLLEGLTTPRRRKRGDDLGR